MRRLLPFLGALLVLIVACTSPVTSLSAPTVTKLVLDTDSGGTLRLSWSAVTSATEYNIYYDGNTTKDTSITGTQIDIATPHQKIDITASNGTIESDKATTDATPVLVASLTAYFTSATTYHTNGIGFAGDGSCIAIDLSSQANWPSVNFVLEDTVKAPGGSTVPGFWSPNMYTTHYNDQENGIAPSAGTSFDAVNKDPVPGTYETRLAITQGAVYPLWISTASTWNVNDHFAKAYITQYDATSGTVKLEVAYQKIGGLRWLKTKTS